MKNKAGKIIGVRFSIVLGFILLAPSLLASDLSMTIFGQYFIPSDSAFKDLYGNGGAFGGKIKYSFGTNYGIWLSGSYYKQEGELSFTKEETVVKVVPLAAGISFQIPGEWLRVYLDGGLGLFYFNEDNPIGKVTSNRLGYLARIGTSFFPVKNLIFDVYMQFSSCKIRPVEIEASIGGLSFGVGLGWRFQLSEEEKSWIWKEVK